MVAAAGRYAIILQDGWEWLPAILISSGLFRSLWEALICVGLCVGLLTLWLGKLLSLMAGAAYAAYIIHLLVVIGIQFGLDTVALMPFTKFVLVPLLGTILSFGVGHLIRQLPGAKKIL